MRIEETAIPSVFLIKPKRLVDTRGYFAETFRADQFAEIVGTHSFVQDNQSLSLEAGTVRGLHFQLPPRAQGKLVSCNAGALWDVAVDLRRGSPTHGKFVAAELSEENGHQLWIPPGFAHGFCTLKPATVVSYKVTDYYSPEHDRGLLWNDPELRINWPVSPNYAILSDKDRNQPRLSELQSKFGSEL
ncbi:dTDP-4-dehydrorhamnose 3,5-epimerase [Ensifer adhaerens]|uniref:dTDP-4-dehydrorhamnose 3,5-epimerase n=1 Tax=Ensifer TaxID=106591 RepID=UPI0017831FA4|nr:MULTISPECIES: dTDP-4-dehydrorhamnose 3,5-epimerase [unclassified Ensifer]MBD9496889.1 dTDP-4-dehydrorhamnose 3,5-epimerase [Ensifer sp. ENS01]MBD9640504.1 dTDP-4-dehydrorhamnose 3,5-epimerase [Ensifer sp. ENS07]